MKTIETFEKEDIAKLDKIVYYFFWNSQDGYLKKNGLPNWIDSLSDADLLKLTEIIKNKPSDIVELKNHIRARLDRLRTDLDEAKGLVNEREHQIEDMKNILETVANSKTLELAFKNLLKV